MSFWTSGALRLKVAGSIVAAVSLGGFAVAAAAVVKEPAPKVVGDPAATDPTTTDPTTTTPTEPPTTEPTTTPTDPPVTDPPPVVDPIPTSPPPACLTHGQRVSKVAHDTPPGPGHGAAVSAAAHNHDGECHEQSADAEEPDVTDDAPESAPPAPAATDDGQDGESHDGGGTANGVGHGGGRDK